VVIAAEPNGRLRNVTRCPTNEEFLANTDIAPVTLGSGRLEKFSVDVAEGNHTDMDNIADL
jgi:hypothetical protein